MVIETRRIVLVATHANNQPAVQAIVRGEGELAQLIALAAEQVYPTVLAAAEDAGDKHFDDGGTPMKSKSNIMTSSKALASVIIIFCLAVALHAAPPTKPESPTTTQKQKQFDNPKQATDALIQATETFDVPALRSEEHTSELQSRRDLVCRLLLE